MSGAGVGGKLRVEERMELLGVRTGVGHALEGFWCALEDGSRSRLLIDSVRRKLRSAVRSGRTCA